MQWGDITHEHHRLKVKAWTDLTDHEHLLNDIRQGLVDCPHRDTYPVLLVGGNRHPIPPHWDVDFVR